MANSLCFILILEYLTDQKQDLCKLQLLNKRTYREYVPRIMSSLNLLIETPPCMLRELEAAI